MTDLAIPEVGDRTRRDQYGRYLVVPPGGKRPVGYTRATRVAKEFDGQGALAPWKATMALTGAMRRPGLHKQFEALLSRHPVTGPWYGSEASKEACKKLVEKMATAGGAGDAADVGDALHSIVEQYNLGSEPALLGDETQADLEAYKTAMLVAGLQVDSEFCEATVVLDELRVAGKSDMLRVIVPGETLPVVADLKTGAAKSLGFTWQPNCIQLAIYAHGDCIYKQGDAVDGSEDERSEMPKVSQTKALIIHLPAGEARCEIHWIDIEAGWEAFERSMWTRQWRSRKDLHNLYVPRHSTRYASSDEPPALDEGDEVTGSRVVALERAFAKLPDEAQAWATATMVAGNNAKVPWNRLSTRPTMRRYQLYKGVGMLAKWGFARADTALLDDMVRAIVQLVTADDTALWPTNPPGMLLATFDVAQATRFADMAGVVAADGHLWGRSEDTGMLRLIVGNGNNETEKQ